MVAKRRKRKCNAQYFLALIRGVEDEMIPVLAFDPVQGGTELDGKVLSFCYFKAHKVVEIAKYLDISDSTYFRKQVLKNLEKMDTWKRAKIQEHRFIKQIRIWSVSNSRRVGMEDSKLKIKYANVRLFSGNTRRWPLYNKVFRQKKPKVK